jgi:hypothetical protein
MVLDDLKWAIPEEGERRRDGWAKCARYPKLWRRNREVEETQPAKELHNVLPPVPAVLHRSSRERDQMTPSDRTRTDGDDIERIG